ncbi:MAG: nucleotidyltransferase domain-containing protein [Candidatus Aenigmarchaeota archaeon]|nr:nucleotidyltransferase domain-containing protein [Candidatus Aenigmarchaeota archaeon]
MLQFHRDILEEFRKLDAKVILFGSVARGDYRLDSDVDIAIITDREDVRERAEKIADRILFEYGKVVSLKFFTSEEFESGSALVNEIKKGEVL